MKTLRKWIIRIFIVVVCLSIIAGVGVYFFAYRVKGESSDKARERIEQARDAAESESRRWLEKVEALKKDLSETIQQTVSGDDETTGVLERLNRLEERIRRYEEEVGPQYREKLRDWREEAGEAATEIRRRGAQAGEKIRSLFRKVTNETESSQTDDTATER